jgi:uncharacterized membrane protein
VRGHVDLKRTIIVSLLCAVVALLAPFEAIRVVAAIPLALVLPGYAITAATFARRPLDWPLIAVLSIALSLVTLALGALLLNYVPGGIGSLSWALLLLLVIVNGCRTAALRRRQAPADRPAWPRLRVSRRDAALLLGGLATATAALVLALTPLPADEAIGFTELWVLPADSAGGAASAAEVGVASQEKDEVAYKLRVSFGEDAPVVRRFSLDPGETKVLRLAAAGAAAEAPVVAALFREDRPGTIYRRVKGRLAPPGASG